MKLCILVKDAARFEFNQFWKRGLFVVGQTKWNSPINLIKCQLLFGSVNQNLLISSFREYIIQFEFIIE